MTVAFLAESMLRVSVLLALALVGLSLLRRRSAALRSTILATAIVSGLAVPPLMLLLPSWQVAIPAPASG